MPTRVEEGSLWFVVSMNWIKKWQQWVYFDIIVGNSSTSDNQATKPPKVNSSDILLEHTP